MSVEVLVSFILTTYKMCSCLCADGTRLYVTTSLFSPWDKQFYPDMTKKVTHMTLIIRYRHDRLINGIRTEQRFWTSLIALSCIYIQYISIGEQRLTLKTKGEQQ
jgi:56kDa selenium binding protein (SBP56)